MLRNTGSLRILVVGCGNMGASHARAFRNMRGVEIVGLVSRGESKHHLATNLSLQVPLFDDVGIALSSLAPDAVCISTYPDTHEAFTLAAIEAGCHVFVEKPLAPDTQGARRMVEAAQSAGRKLVVGYILRHHPTWQKFIGIARTLGSPLVMRMNLNQQSSGAEWQVHRGLLASASPIVDCGVHYVDVMCQWSQPGRCEFLQSEPASTRASPTAGVTTANCRSSSAMARWAGTRPDGDR